MEFKERFGQSQGQETTDRAADRGADVAVLAAGASVLLSWYQFYVRDNKTQGLFVGLWAPTILAFASYLKQLHTERRRKSGFSGQLREFL